MNLKQLINMSLAYNGINKKDLAEKLGWSPQRLNQRLNTGKFTLDELNKIAKAVGADRAELHFYFKDGTII